jgi:hypothetical protein
MDLERFRLRRFLEQLDWALATRFQAERDLIVTGGFRDGREIVRELEGLRQSGRLERDAEGRYVYRPAAAAG